MTYKILDKPRAIRTKEANTAREIFKRLGFQLKMTTTSRLICGNEVDDIDLYLTNPRLGGMCMWANGSDVDEAICLLLDKIWRYRSFSNFYKWLDVSLPKANTLKEFIMKMNLRGY